MGDCWIRYNVSLDKRIYASGISYKLVIVCVMNDVSGFTICL